MTTTTATVRVLVVNDHPVARSEIARALEVDGDVAVVGRCDCSGALDAVRALRPDVVAIASTTGGRSTAAVESIMAFAPTPVLVLRAPDDLTASAQTRDLEAGAVGVVRWPTAPGTDHQLRERVRVVRNAVVVRHPRARLRPGSPPRTAVRTSAPHTRMVGMAASTGGPHTLVQVVSGLADIAVPVLIVQHIHPEFVNGFVEWIARATGAVVAIAEDGMFPAPGVFHIAPAGSHLKVAPDRRLVLDPDPPSLHRPSANELFNSMAESLGRAAIGVLLTGMGDDGAAGLLAVHRAGGTTIVQDEATSAIDGMPKAARDLGAAGWWPRSTTYPPRCSTHSECGHERARSRGQGGRSTARPRRFSSRPRAARSSDALPERRRTCRRARGRRLRRLACG